jgi:hypothetical protein
MASDYSYRRRHQMVTPNLLSTQFPTWAWDVPSAGVVSVLCSASAYKGSQYIGQVTGAAKIKVWEPYTYYGHKATTTNYADYPNRRYVLPVSNPENIAMIFAGIPNTTINWTPGMKLFGAMGTPALFALTAPNGVGGQGFGAWAFVQTANCDRDRFWPDGSTTHWPPTSGQFALDNYYPYPPGWFPADSQPGGPRWTTDDSPGSGILNAIAIVANDSFRMFQVFAPPSNSFGTVPVASWRLAWTWTAGASRANPTSAWPVPGGTVTANSYLLHPASEYQWEVTLENQ